MKINGAATPSRRRTAVLAAGLLSLAALAVGILLGRTIFAPVSSLPSGNYSDEMKMEYRTNFNDAGPNTVERDGDHKGSPYFYSADIYHAQSTDSLSILPQFETIQQTSWWSCGVSCTEMVLNYFGRRDDWNEESLANLREDHSKQHIGTCLDQIIDMFEAVGGFDLETTYDYADHLDAINMSFIRQHIQDGTPILVGWNDWGGHWQVIIGYDTMGTEYEGDDVIIVADPFDTTDHNQDGYGVYGAERFIYNFTFYDFFGDAPDHLRDKCFVAVKPAADKQPEPVPATDPTADSIASTLPTDADGFVLLSDAIPDAIQEIRYYSTYNFVGERIDGYEEPCALITQEAALALKAVSDDVLAQGYRLKIYDVYRPQKAVDHFVRWAEALEDEQMKPFFYPDVDKSLLFEQGYIAAKSGHSRGSTVDLTLVSEATGKELDMGGTFDWFGERSHPDYTESLTDEQITNRNTLREAMIRHGFQPLDTEWWHFTLENEPYPDTYFEFAVSSQNVS